MDPRRRLPTRWRATGASDSHRRPGRDPGLRTLADARCPTGGGRAALRQYERGPGERRFRRRITEELIERLAKVQGLRVVARTSRFQYKGHAQDLREIGRKLNATAVLEGSIRRSGDRFGSPPN